jgi:tetratricopeptide (TPR) repeat protein
MKKGLLIICILLCAYSGFAQTFAWSENCLGAYAEALKLNFNKADQLLIAEQKANPNNEIISYVESQIDFIRCFISEDVKDLDALKEQNSARINKIAALKVKSPYTRLLMAEYNIQTAIARLKFEEYLGAVYETRRAFRMLEENNKLYPDFKPTLKGLGFIHAFVGTVPRNYQWMLNLLGFSGTIDQGLKEMRELLAASGKNEYAWLHDETTVILTFLEMNLIRKKDNDQIRKRMNSIADIENKPLMLFAKCVYHAANAENDSVIDLLSQRNSPDDSYHLYYLDYMEGIARLNNLDIKAENCFKKYVNGFKGKSFVKSAFQRLAWLRLIQGDLPGYHQYIKMAGEKGSGNTFSDEDKQAIKEAQDNEVPNVILLRSRLLFDGGYYQRSIAEISGKPTSDFPSLRDKLEFTYRLARIFDKTNKKEKAIQYYQQTIENGKNFKFYFAANSALQLGLLYEEKGDVSKAAAYYRQCLGMGDHEYQNSLDQKAKAGLSRVEEK